MLLIAVGSAAAGAVLALAAADGFARQDKAPRASQYTNGVYGFSIQPPAFARADKNTNTQAVMFFAPPKNGFSSNLNVMIQEAKTSLDNYQKLSVGEIKKQGFKLVSEARKKIAGRDALYLEYEGEIEERPLKWMMLAVFDADRVYLSTGTLLKADDVASRELKASLDSFSLPE
jgi:hypothetical protein